MNRYLFALVLTASMVFLTGCSSSNEEGHAPHTGNPAFEEEVAVEAASGQQRIFSAVEVLYVTTNRLNVRSSAEIREDNIVGALTINDQVKVLEEIAGTDFVKILIVKTNEEIGASEAYYVSKNYLSKEKNTDEQRLSRGKYFMIQNVASEKLRVYEKLCDDGRCQHKLVLEANIAVGEKKKGTMTILGSFTIQKWSKFYQDGAGRYPSWYDPNYPAVPKPGASVTSWTSRSVLPYKGAKVRGAFGWYTALVGPNAASQWTHGTLGWGADKDKYIDATRGFWANLFTAPRSHGCTRTDNEAIAFVRHLLDVGAPVVKVYAIESLADNTLARYNQEKPVWNYILTKNGVRVDGQRPDREEVLRAGTPRNQWLEEGSYEVDMYPSPKEFKSGSSGAKAGKNANVYGLDRSDMRGVFLVDAGLLVGYAHPARLTVGGYGRSSLPGFMVSRVSPSQQLALTQNK